MSTPDDVTAALIAELEETILWLDERADAVARLASGARAAVQAAARIEGARIRGRAALLRVVVADAKRWVTA